MSSLVEMPAAAADARTETIQPSFAIKVEKNVSIPVRHGGAVAADVFRPDAPASTQFPVLITMGVYGKDIPFKAFNPVAWPRMEMKSGEDDQDYLNWETPLPDYWVPRGYVVVRCDQPGSGGTSGKLNVFGRETQLAFYDAIEWAGTQPWSNGKVGILGNSYYGVLQWLVAQHQPPHLAAILPFQGFTDYYRDCVRHGGILTAGFIDFWYPNTVVSRQFGAPTGTSTVKLSASELAANSDTDIRVLVREEPLAYATHEYYRERTPDLSKINVPIFAWANDDHFGLHLRGTIDGFSNAECAPYRRLHTYTAPEPDMMYTRVATDMHRRFFDHFLKGDDNGFETEPRVAVTVKKGGEAFALRTGNAYPLEGTVARRMYLDCGTEQLADVPPRRVGSLVYKSGNGSSPGQARISTSALPADLELIGPLRLHLTISVADHDTDLFVSIREYGRDGNEVTTRGLIPISMGWLRASMRNADPAKSTDFRAWHTYDRSELLTPGEPVTLDVNLWPAAWILEKGNTLSIEIGGSDQRGLVGFTHPAFGPYSPDGATPASNGAPSETDVTIHSGGSDPSYLVLPFVPGAED